VTKCHLRMTFARWDALGNVYLVTERVELTPDDVRDEVGDTDGILQVLAHGDDWVDIRIWNPDGSTAELSGNGTRIAARWLARRGGVDQVRIVVGPREVAARMGEGREVELDIGAVEVGETETLAVGGEDVELTPVSVGNPHAVIRREPDREQLIRLGPLVENHERFPERTNVQLVRVDGPHELSVGVWERGAGETLSSGTSAVAASAAAVANGWCESPVTVHLAGGDLRVQLGGGEARLTGPAEEICTVELAEEFIL
jgi:diaminopimelate epimerase